MNSNNCFTHKSTAAAGECNYCHASYCKSCLSYIGKDKELICENCHGTLSQRFYQSMLKRKNYIYIGYIIIIISAYLSYMNFGTGTGTLTLILLLMVLGFIMITKKRIAEMKLFLKTEPFS